MSIVSDDDVNTAEQGFGWTTVTYPWKKVGMRAFGLIDQQVKGGTPLDERSRHVILPAKLTIRESCGMHLNAPKN